MRYEKPLKTFFNGFSIFLSLLSEGRPEGICLASIAESIKKSKNPVDKSDLPNVSLGEGMLL